MEANKEPEKIWVKQNAFKNTWPLYIDENSNYGGVEYIRADAFIKKACEWLEENVEKHISADGEYTVYYEEMFEDFKNYMKGE